MAFETRMNGGWQPSPVPAGPGADAERIRDVLPEIRHKVYDVRGIVGCMVGRGSMFELKARYGHATAGARVCMLAVQARRLCGGMDEHVGRTWPRTR